MHHPLAVAIFSAHEDAGTSGGNLTARGLPTLREAYSAWIVRTFESCPSSLVSLTFAPRTYEQQGSMTGPSLSRVLRAGSRFAEDLKSKGGVSFFGVLETGGWNGRRHCHFLTEQGITTRLATFSHSVREGFTNVRLVDRPMSAAEYVAKYVSKDSVFDEAHIWIGGERWLATS